RPALTPLSPRTLPPPPTPLFPYTTLFRSRESKTHDCIRQHRHADSTPPTAHIEQTSPLEDPGRPVRSAPPSSRRHRHLRGLPPEDRKSTRLNSSHVSISYAVFCLKKKKHP